MTGSQPERKDEPSPYTELSSDEAKRTFGELLSRVGFAGELVVVTRHGKPVVAMISIKDFELVLAARGVTDSAAVPAAV